MSLYAAKRWGVLFSVLLASMPLFVSADAACPALTRSLSLGAQGEDVRQLQRFLMNEGELLSDNVTGAFNSRTQIAVGNWQKIHGLVTSKDPGSGWGIVGPRTRAAIAAQCGGSNGNTPLVFASTPSSAAKPSVATPAVAKNVVGQCKIVPHPAQDCASGWQGARGKNGCVASWYCVAIVKTAAASTPPTVTSTSTRVSATNAPPVITAFTGPDTLRVGETGGWSVTATDPERAALTYSFTWSDSGGTAFDQISQLAQTFTPSKSATHKYAYAGNYRVTVVVHDSAGNTTKSSMSVVVSGGTSTGPGFDLTLYGTTTTYATSTNTSQPYTYWCPNGVGTSGYWSQTPCNSGVTEIWATSTNPYGSSSSNVSEGGICAPENRQEFVACPHMQNCMGGGTYYQCKNSIWTRMIVY